MNTGDARQSISDLPLDLFGDVDMPVPAVATVREPDIFCWRCQAMLTEGLATCPQCGAQNELIPIVTSSPPSFEHDEADSDTYVGRVAFAFTYMLRDIGRSTARTLDATWHQFLDRLSHGRHSRNRR
jgi:hypothetical protein